MIAAFLASTGTLLAGFVIGYMSKGISITISKEEAETKEVPYNESLLDTLPTHIRQEIDLYNKGVNPNG